jgi:hypothetical protein
MVIIMPDANIGQGGIRNFGERNLQMFEKELKESIIPFAESNYRIKKVKKTVHWPDFQWAEFIHCMPEFRIRYVFQFGCFQFRIYAADASGCCR